MSFDAFGNIFLAGGLGNWNNSNPDSVLIENRWIKTIGFDALVVKLNPKGDLIWIKTATGKRNENIRDMCIDRLGNCFTVGEIWDWSLAKDTVVFDNDTLFSDGNWGQIFIAKLDLDKVLDGIKVNSKISPQFSFFPNPAHGVFTVRGAHCEEYSLFIMDSFGKCIKTVSFQDSYDHQIDLSPLSKGIYFVDILTGENRLVRKIVIE